MKNSIDLLLAVLDDAYAGKSWQGPNLKGSMRGLSAEQAAWRPGPRRHNIWELVMHAAYWKYTVKRRLLNEKRGSFPLNGSNWFAPPLRLRDTEWKEARQLLDRIHQSLRLAIAALDPDDLDKPIPGGRYPCAKILYGVAAHDVYHTGQINLIKRLMKA